MKIRTYLLLMLLPLMGALAGCAGINTFHEVARAGDTVAVASGWKHGFSRDTVRATITPASGSPIVYQPGNGSIRGVINLYPDPLASSIVSVATGQDITPFATIYGSLIGPSFTNNDKDWWQTTVFVDLPATLPVGLASIYLENVNDPNEFWSANVDIVAGDGRANLFDTEIAGPIGSDQMASLERVGHYTISFDGPTIPYSMQITLTHSPDVDHGGVGRAYVVNPRGDVKSVAWADDGFTTKVILTPSKEAQIDNMPDFKFYIAGGIVDLSQQPTVQAYDISGSPITGVTATIALQ